MQRMISYNQSGLILPHFPLSERQKTPNPPLTPPPDSFAKHARRWKITLAAQNDIGSKPVVTLDANEAWSESSSPRKPVHIRPKGRLESDRAAGRLITEHEKSEH